MAGILVKSKAKKSDLSVGVTLHIRDSQQSLWENGIFQNCYFLVELLKELNIFKRVFLVNGGPADPTTAEALLAYAPAPVLSFDEAMNELDLIIELSAQINADWGRGFVNKGGRIIGMHVANDYIIDAERMVFDLAPGFRMEPLAYSEIWTLQAFEKTCASYYRFGLHAPVYVMPHLWSPRLLEQSLAANGCVDSFNYVQGWRSWRLACLEPNLCTVKTCHLPLLLADVAYRMNPRIMDYLRIYNALKIKDHRDFIAYARSMDSVDHGLVTFEGRLPIYEIMGPQCDAIISHQWENAQNYLYYEALYGGFPLIHNSDLLGGCGYAYKSFDPEDGALALLQAFASHNEQLENYRTEARAFLAGLHPSHDTNVQKFGAAINRVMTAEIPL